jgi:hypothetical protein
VENLTQEQNKTFSRESFKKFRLRKARNLKMEISFIEEGYSFTCRCCLVLSDIPMDSIFECSYEDVELQEILSIVSALSVFGEDGK